MNVSAQPRILPTELMDKCIGSRIWIIMKDQLEFSGILTGFDEFINMVLTEVTRFEPNSSGLYVKHHLDSILLNGNQVCMLVPGGEGPANCV